MPERFGRREALVRAFTNVTKVSALVWLASRPFGSAPKPRFAEGITLMVATPVFARSFVASSWWNTPIPAGVGVDSRSATMIAKQAKSCPPPTVKSSSGGWALPWSEVSGTAGTLATIKDAQSNIVKVYIDVTVGDMSGDDGAIVFRDWRTGVEISTFETKVVRHSDGKVDTSKPIMCKSFGSYRLGTDGIAKQSGGDKANSGHRGVAPSSMALFPTDQYGPILHRLKVALGQPADTPGPNWPMYSLESPRSGGIPEGAVIRLKGSSTNVASPVQVAAHAFGFIVGDTAGAGKSALKTVQGHAYGPETMNALDGLTWADWEVMALGWRA